VTAAGFRWDRDPDGASPALDAAAAWTFGHGADFDLTAGEERERADDFSHAVVLDPAAMSDPAACQVAHVVARAELGPTRQHAFPAPLRARSIPATEPRGLPSPGALRHVERDMRALVGVIDDGINIAHARFGAHLSGVTQSRVAFAWLQDGVRRKDGSVPFGREWTGAEIDSALQEEASEADVLARLGLVDFSRPGRNHLAHATSHGTHVLDIAAGAHPDASEGAPGIVAVQLPTLIAYEVSGQQVGPFAIAGLHYILERRRILAARLGRPLPLVVNFSYGIAGGPHDGTHYVEDAIARLLAARRSEEEGSVEVVLPSGNRNLDRGAAARGSAATAPTSLPLRWRVPPDDGTSSYLEVWLPPGAEDLSVAIAAPGEPLTGLADLGTERPLVLWRGKDRASVLARAVLDKPGFPGPNPPRRTRLHLALAPTAPEARGRAAAPHGDWQISVSARIPGGSAIEAWVLRDNSTVGYRSRGRQSAFEDDAYERLDHRGAREPLDPERLPEEAIVRRAGTVSGFATGGAVRVVAAAVLGGTGPAVADYSGTAARHQRSPDLAAAADRSPLRPGLVAAGTRSGSVSILNGTSIAAPQLVRALVQALQQGAGEKAFERVEQRLLALNDHCGGRRGGKGLLPLDPLLAFANEGADAPQRDGREV